MDEALGMRQGYWDEGARASAQDLLSSFRVRVTSVNDDSMIPAEFDEPHSADLPVDSLARTRRQGDGKARQDIERVSALLREQAPELVAHDTEAPAIRKPEATLSRWPLIATFGVSGLAWIGLAIWFLE